MRDIAVAEHLAIRPGQIWLVEQFGSILHPFDREAVADTNVVIYERSLAPLVARVLTLGAYGEPLPPAASPVIISPRSLRFAAEGWSVVQLTEARCTGPRDAAMALLRSGISPDLPVTRITKPPARPGRIDESSLRDLLDIPERPGQPSDVDTDPVTLVFGPFGGVYPTALPAHSHLFTAHGLAG